MALPAPVVMSTLSGECLGAVLASWGVQIGGFSSGTWPAANRAYYLPFRLDEPWTVRRMFVFNGSTASGNIDLGIYSQAGTRLVSSGSTAQAGTNGPQWVDVTDTPLSAGVYYLALAASATTTTVFRTIQGTLSVWQAMGVREESSALPLPATATFTAPSGSVYIPLFGASERTV